MSGSSLGAFQWKNEFPSIFCEGRLSDKMRLGDAITLLDSDRNPRSYQPCPPPDKDTSIRPSHLYKSRHSAMNYLPSGPTASIVLELQNIVLNPTQKKL